jgi:hypothetical protein
MANIFNFLQSAIHIQPYDLQGKNLNPGLFPVKDIYAFSL